MSSWYASFTNSQNVFIVFAGGKLAPNARTRLSCSVRSYAIPFWSDYTSKGGDTVNDVHILSARARAPPSSCNS
jgi:hypothetical protein